MHSTSVNSRSSTMRLVQHCSGFCRYIDHKHRLTVGLNMPMSFAFGTAITEVSYGANSYRDPTVVDPLHVQDKNSLPGFHVPSIEDKEQRRDCCLFRITFKGNA